MATRVGNFLGVFAGWLVWRSVGGLPGLLIAVFLVIPLATAIAHAVLVKIGGTGEEVNPPALPGLAGCDPPAQLDR